MGNAVLLRLRSSIEMGGGRMTREEARALLLDYIKYLDEHDMGGDGVTEAIKTVLKEESVTEFADRCRECGKQKMRILEPALDEMYIVSYFDKEVDEPVVTAFNNRDAAEACYETFKQEHDITAIDHVKVYKEFKILDNDEGGVNYGI